MNAGRIIGDVHLTHVGPEGAVASPDSTIADEAGSGPALFFHSLAQLGLLDWVVGGGRKRIARASTRLQSGFAVVPLTGDALARAARDYRHAMRLGLRLKASETGQWFAEYDQQIPLDKYNLAFRKKDLAWLAQLLRKADQSVAAVVFDLATRLQLEVIQRQARDRMIEILGGERAAQTLTHYYLLWNKYDLLETATLGRSLHAYLAHSSFENQTREWLKFFDQIPESIIPQFFEIYFFLGDGKRAVELSDTQKQKNQAIECCLKSPRLDDVLTGIDLASSMTGRSIRVRELNEHAGDLLWRSADYRSALEHYQHANRIDRVGECHEKLGNYLDALTCCPADQSERLAMLAEICQGDIDTMASRSEFEQAIHQVDQIISFLRGATRSSEILARRLKETLKTRERLIGAGRHHFYLSVQLAEDGDKPAAHRSWSQFEEAGGDYAAAAEQAEQGEDLYSASRLFSRAGQFGDADRVLKEDHTVRALTIRAKAREAGGDILGAARFYDGAGDPDQAVQLFVKAGQFDSAARSLIRWHGDAAIEDRRLRQLLRKSGAFAKLTTRCLAAARLPQPSDQVLEELRTLRNEASVPVHLMPEVDSVLGEIDARERIRFEAQAQSWIAQARREIDTRFAGIWGFDLGTTTCVVAIYDTRLKAAVLCPWKAKKQFAATLSLDKEGNELVGLSGEETLASWLSGHISASKQLMGTRKVFQVHDRRYRPEEVAARFIRHARQIVENFLASMVRERVEELARAELGEVREEWLVWAQQHHDLRLDRPKALVTIPAYFTNNQKYATRAACEIAGVEVVRLIHEPTAACVTAARERRLTGQIVVVDLGAGTFDISQLDVAENVYEVHGVLGDNKFGSRDFDVAIASALEKRLKNKGMEVPSKGSSRRRLHVAAENLKISLSAQQDAEILLPAFAGGQHVTLSLDRAEMASLLAEPLSKLRQICISFRRSLSAQPDHLVLVGRPMLSPLVCDEIEKVFGLKRVLVSDPQTAVASGAALQAAVLDRKLSEVVLLDVTPLPLGIRAFNEKNEEEFSIVINANTKIPVSHQEIYTTREKDQASVDIEIFNGQIETGSKIGQFQLAGIQERAGRKPKIVVTFSIDASCVLEVAARDDDSGSSNSVRIADSTLLSPTEISEMTRRYERQRERSRQLEELMMLHKGLRDAISAAADDPSGALWSDFSELKAGYRPTAEPLDPATHQTLFQIFRDDNSARTDLDLCRRSLPPLISAARKFLQRPADAVLSEQLDEGMRISAHLQAELGQRESLISALRNWNRLLTALNDAAASPVEQFRRQYAAENYRNALEVLAGVPEEFSDLGDLERQLHCLAETGEMEAYRSLLLTSASSLGVVFLDPENKSPYLSYIFGALARVRSADSNPQLVYGAAFCLADGIAVTSQVVAAKMTGPTELSFGLDGKSARVLDMRVDAQDGRDAALLTYSGHGPTVGLRTGYTMSVRVGDRVWAADPGLEGGSPRLVPGVINKLGTTNDADLRFFDVGAAVSAEFAGGPLVNDFGEVIGLIAEVTPGEEDTRGALLALSIDALIPPVEQLKADLTNQDSQATATTDSRSSTKDL